MSLRKIALCFLASFLLTLSFPAYNVWPFAWIALIPLLYVIDQTSLRHATICSYITGLFFYAQTVYWICHVSVFGYFFVSAFYAIFWGLFGWGSYHLLHRGDVYHHVFFKIVGIAAWWVALEYVRSVMPIFGFGWVLLGYSQSTNVVALQTASVCGVWGLSFLIMVVTMCAYFALHAMTSHRRLLGAMILSIGCIVSAVYWWGSVQLGTSREGVPIRVGIIQGNIPQEEKWDPQARNIIIEKYTKLLEFISYDAPDLVILPEACYPGDFVREYETSSLKTVIAREKMAVLMGAIRVEDYTRVFNSAFYILSTGAIQAFYDKIHLVPFGEYIPVEPVFSLLGLTKLAYSLGVGDFIHGKDYAVFSLPLKNGTVVRFSSLICFEDVFPSLARTFVMKGAQFLVVITNDAWFGKTSAPYQHEQASIFRAVENHCYVFRSANTGVSSFIAPWGEVLDRVKDKTGEEIFVTGGVSRTIFVAPAQTFYQKYGYVFPVMCLLLALGCLVVAFQSKTAR